jgi:hypothetical protein
MKVYIGIEKMHVCVLTHPREAHTFKLQRLLLLTPFGYSFAGVYEGGFKNGMKDGQGKWEVCLFLCVSVCLV